MNVQAYLILLLVLAATVAAALCAAVMLFRRAGRMQKERATEEFRRRREWLEAEFLSLAAASGRPRGLTWADCDFEDNAYLARDRVTGELRALVGVTIRFEAVLGGGMEDVEAVHNLRSATAVFRYEKGKWKTDGRAVFNLTPPETIRHFSHELEPVI